MTGPGSGSRRWKLWGSLGCIAGLIAALWFGPRMVDWSPFKPEIAAFMSNELGVGVDLRGPLQIELLPQPRITAADIRITGTTANGHIRWLRGSLDPRGLLTGRLLPRDVQLVEAKLTLPFAQSEAPRYRGQTAVEIQDGHLTLTGGPDWLPDVIERINGRLSLGGGAGRLFAFDGEARLTEEPVGLAVEGDGKGRLVLTLAHGPSASDLVLEGGPTEDGGWNGTVTLVLEEAGFLSTLHAEAITRLIGDGPAAIDAKVTVSPSGIVTIAADRVGTTRLAGRATATIVPGRRTAFDISVALNRAAFADRPPSPIWIAQDLADALSAFRGVDITARIGIDRIDLPGGAIRQAQISAAAGGGLAVIENASAILPGDTDVSLFGSLRPEAEEWILDGEIALVGPDARTGLTILFPGAEALLASLPADRLRSVDISARIYADHQGLEVTELYGRVDETSWAGALSAQAGQGIDLLLQGDRLNLDRYMAGGTDATDVGLAVLQTLPGLTSGVEHRLSLTLDQATVSGIRADGASVELTYDPGGRIGGDFRTASLAGADIGGGFNIDLSDPDLPAELSFRLETPAPDRFLGALGVPARQAARAAALGTTTATLDISGTPRSGYGYALEALGSDGDIRLSGLVRPGPNPTFEVTKGTVNLGDISLFHIAARCDGGDAGVWLCRDLSAEMAGLRFAGILRLDGSGADRQADLSVQALEMDVGLFAARGGLPVLPEGEVRMTGSLSGRAPTYLSALIGGQGDLQMSGDVALTLRRGGGGKFGNFDTLRARLRETFGTPSPLTGRLRIAPEQISADLRLDGHGASLTGDINLRRSTDSLRAALSILPEGGTEAVLSMTADGPAGAPDVKLKGPWITGR